VLRQIQSRVIDPTNLFSKPEIAGPSKSNPGVLYNYVTYDTFTDAPVSGVLAEIGKSKILQ